jgi:hypothetical protein
MYRLRAFSPSGGQCISGVYPTLAAADAAKDHLSTTYAAQAETQDLTLVIERFEPTRALRDQVTALTAALGARLGETDPVLRVAQGLPPEGLLLAAHDALTEALRVLSQQVYEEEGQF